jgi:hypothetical protein
LRNVERLRASPSELRVRLALSRRQVKRGGVYAYESRMHRPPPQINIPGRSETMPHILALRYITVDGKTYDISGQQLARDLAFAMVFCSREGDRLNDSDCYKHLAGATNTT